MSGENAVTMEAAHVREDHNAVFEDLQPPSGSSMRLSTLLRQTLVTSLQQANLLQSYALQQALLKVPLELFLAAFYEVDKSSRELAWTYITYQDDPEKYLKRIYANEGFVTRVSERLLPLSCSLPPTLLVRMLEVLDVRAGQRVLEIGTDTGYTTALLALIVGDAHQVVTIEADAAYAHQVQQTLERVSGSGVTVVTGDGFWGWSRGGPYDRIIALASVPTVPLTWIEQLRRGGKLLLDLRGSLASGFFVLEKTQRGAVGSFLPGPLHLMPLQSRAFVQFHQSGTGRFSLPAHVASFIIPDFHRLPNKLFDDAFRWFLQWRITACQIHCKQQLQCNSGVLMRTIFVCGPCNDDVIRFQQQAGHTYWRVDVYSTPFWQRLQQVLDEFIAIGEPTTQQYRLEIEDMKPILIIGPLKIPI
jgi:protein-L-isoaspartate(D-aspartate) O-methyltransferase